MTMKRNILLLAISFIATSAYIFAEDGLSASDVSLQPGQTAKLEISLTNEMHAYKAFIFDIQLPMGVNIADKAVFNSSRVKEPDYNLLIERVSKDTYRVLWYHNANQSIEKSDGLLLTLILEGTKDIINGENTGRLISNFTNEEGGSAALGFIDDTNMWTYGYPDATFTLSLSGGTGIDDIQVDPVDANGPIYDLRGQKVTKAGKGIYIMNGKKILNK